MKVTSVPRSINSREQNAALYDPDKLIRIIDELIMSAPDIPNSTRISTSTGTYNKHKCRELKSFLEHRTDLRSLRIKNLLDRVLKIVGK